MPIRVVTKEVRYAHVLSLTLEHSMLMSSPAAPGLTNSRALRSRVLQASSVRPGTAGLLIDKECSRVRDSSWMYLTSFVTTRIGIELAAVQRKLPDRVVVGLQLYSARTFHVTLSPRYIRAGRDPLQTIYQHLRQYKPHRM